MREEAGDTGRGGRWKVEALLVIVVIRSLRDVNPNSGPSIPGSSLETNNT